MSIVVPLPSDLDRRAIQIRALLLKVHRVHQVNRLDAESRIAPLGNLGEPVQLARARPNRHTLAKRGACVFGHLRPGRWFRMCEEL